MKKQDGQEQGSAVKMKPVFKEARVDDVWACVPLMRVLAQSRHRNGWAQFKRLINCVAIHDLTMEILGLPYKTSALAQSGHIINALGGCQYKIGL